MKKILAALAAVAAGLMLTLGLVAPAQARANTETPYPLSIQYVVGVYADPTNTYLVTNNSLTSQEVFTVSWSQAGTTPTPVAVSDVITLAPGASTEVDSPLPRWASLGVFGAQNSGGATESAVAHDASGLLPAGTILGVGQAQPYDYLPGNDTRQVVNILTGKVTSASKVK